MIDIYQPNKVVVVNKEVCLSKSSFGVLLTMTHHGMRLQVIKT